METGERSEKYRREYATNKSLQPLNAVKCETSPRFSLTEND
jgi:hypothetical protein